MKKGLKRITVADHNTIRGGMEAKRFAYKYGISPVVGSGADLV